MVLLAAHFSFSVSPTIQLYNSCDGSMVVDGSSFALSKSNSEVFGYSLGNVTFSKSSLLCPVSSNFEVSYPGYRASLGRDPSVWLTTVAWHGDACIHTRPHIANLRWVRVYYPI